MRGGKVRSVSTPPIDTGVRRFYSKMIKILFSIERWSFVHQRQKVNKHSSEEDQKNANQGSKTLMKEVWCLHLVPPKPIKEESAKYKRGGLSLFCLYLSLTGGRVKSAPLYLGE